MSVPTQQAGEASEAVGDAELIAQVRAGDPQAYAELFSRHHAAAVGLARRYARNPSDAEDLAAEGFANVYTALTGGAGPDAFFRAYLFTSISRLAARGNVKASRHTLSDEMEKYEGEQPYDDPVMLGFESDTVATAFRTLPERWQAVLWYTEVDGMAPAAVAPLLGLSANGVSALALRAREGLRQAYLQAHMDASAIEDRCAPFADKLGAHARGALSPRNEAKVREHLDDCPRCTAALLQLQDVGAGMRGIVFPLVTGLAFLPAAASKAAVGGLLLGIGEWFRQGVEKVGLGNTVLAGAATATIVAGGVAFGLLQGPTTPERPAAVTSPPPAAAAAASAPAAAAPAAALPPVASIAAPDPDPVAAVDDALGAAPAPFPAPATAAQPAATVPAAAAPTVLPSPPPMPTPVPAPSQAATTPSAFPYLLTGAVVQSWNARAGQRTDSFALSADLLSGGQQTATLTLDIAYPASAQGTSTVASGGWNCRSADPLHVRCTHHGVLKGGALPPVQILWTTAQPTLPGIVATASLGTLAVPAVFGA